MKEVINVCIFTHFDETINRLPCVKMGVRKVSRSIAGEVQRSVVVARNTFVLGVPFT